MCSGCSTDEALETTGRMHRKRTWLVLITGLVMVVLATVGTWAALLSRDLPGPEEILLHTTPPSSFVYDRNGHELYEVVDPELGKHTPLVLSAFPAACSDATVATEDSNFYHHAGVDVLAIVRAAWMNWRSGHIVSGASTLTQQVARTLLLEPEERYERTLRRKLREALLAWRLERQFSKEEILALYLNQTYYGHFAYGMEAAAQAYLGKHVGELDLAECALLAGLPQSPAGYNPLENPEAADARQAIVLDLMVRHDRLSPEEAARAKAEQLQYASTPFPMEAPHFVMYVLGEVERQLGTDVLRGGGLRIHTTLDLDWQHQAQAIVRRRLEQLADDPDAPPNRRIDNAAMVAMDPASGAVRVMVGSPDYFDARISGAVNGALVLRQPGSAIKPLTYAAAFDPAKSEEVGREVYTAATLVSDVRSIFPTREGVPYVPLNYDLRFHGPVQLRQALASSFNVPAVKVLEHIGVNSLVEQAHSLGITTFSSGEEHGLSLTLGGGEVRLLDLTSAYAAFANGGGLLQPLTVERVEDLNGRVLLPAAARSSVQAIAPQVAYLVTDILADDRARMAAFGEGSVLSLPRPAAVKTGTTSDWRDNWTIGYTPDLVVGVWVGNADNHPMHGVSGVDGAAPIWHDLMEAVLRDQPPQAFEKPAGMVELEVCADSGLLPTEDCPRRRTELFIAGTEPQQPCHMHQRVRLDTRTGLLAGDATPSEYVTERVYFVLPADMQEWARQEQFPQPPQVAGSIVGGQLIEVSESGVGDEDGRSALCSSDPKACLLVTSPDPNAHYRLRASLPGQAQRIEVAARPVEGVTVTEITLLVDGEPLASMSQPPYHAWWQLSEGRHEFRASGRDLLGRQLWSLPVYVSVSE